MGTFISGGSGFNNQPKVDLVSVPAGANAVNFAQAADWNQIYNALLDVQSWERGGAAWRGIAQQAADPAPTGITNYLWLKSDGSAQVGGAGLVGSLQLQPHEGRKRVTKLVPNQGGANFDKTGLTAVQVGTITTPSLASTTMATSRARVRHTSSSSASSTSCSYGGFGEWWLGNAAGLGGFFMAATFSVGDASLVATANMFVGVDGNVNTNHGDVKPSTLTNIIGFGCDNGDTNLQVYASGSSTQARASLGSSFPVNTTGIDVYECLLYAAPNASTVTYQVTRLNTGAVATGSVTGAQLPSNTTFLTFQMYRSNGGTASAVALDVHRYYAESWG